VKQLRPLSTIPKACLIWKRLSNVIVQCIAPGLFIINSILFIRIKLYFGVGVIFYCLSSYAFFICLFLLDNCPVEEEAKRINYA